MSARRSERTECPTMVRSLIRSETTFCTDWNDGADSNAPRSMPLNLVR